MRVILAELVLAVLPALSGCTRELEGAPCPCTDGFVCCATENVCIRDEAMCPALVTSAPGAYWKTDSTLVEGATVSPDVVVTDAEAQTWVGFGGAFNELGWQYLSALSSAERERALELLFGDDGARFSMGRIPIGANDYAISRYSLDETANDFAMAEFSISRDMENLVPYVQAALKIRPDIRFWASPWTPPTWMKKGPFPEQEMTSPAASPFDGGAMTNDPEMLRAYAQYFVKFVQQYAQLGIAIDTVAPQNEPQTLGGYPSCSWDPATYATFIGQHLGPALKAAQLETHVMLGTLSDANDKNFIDAVLADTDATSYVAVVGAQWNMLESVITPRDAGVQLWQTEHICGNCPASRPGGGCQSITPKDDATPAPNDHDYAIESWHNLHDWINEARVSSYSAWNMVLDPLGLGNSSSLKWHQNALLVADTSQLTITPAYYVFKHLSRYVQPGAKVLLTTSDSALSFKNPNGELVTVLFNEGRARNMTVDVGRKRFSFDMPQSGWATLVSH
ncbi:MAG TPA: glycoside hydrolase family 30 beta sandwich domain-containing protein [Polyangiaceae bacterium]|nr:glycoside hydrolase family 30 beta sandwich domain-containing protein [Polyangiaceae bacterium]